MKKLSVLLTTDETITHTGRKISTYKDDFGFVSILDTQRPLTGGFKSVYLATYNPAFIVRMWDVLESGEVE